MKKKLLLGLGSAITIVAPVVAVVSCSVYDTDKLNAETAAINAEAERTKTTYTMEHNHVTYNVEARGTEVSVKGTITTAFTEHVDHALIDKVIDTIKNDAKVNTLAGYHFEFTKGNQKVSWTITVGAGKILDKTSVYAAADAEPKTITSVPAS